jgi:hypothetical protein
LNQAEWYALYCDALLEHDPVKLCTRIQMAEVAIFSRIQDLVQDPDSSHEREIIANALSALRALQRDLQRYQDERQIAS